MIVGIEVMSRLHLELEWVGVARVWWGLALATGDDNVLAPGRTACGIHHNASRPAGRPMEGLLIACLCLPAHTAHARIHAAAEILLCGNAGCKSPLAAHSTSAGRRRHMLRLVVGEWSRLGVPLCRVGGWMTMLVHGCSSGTPAANGLQANTAIEARQSNSTFYSS